MVLKKIGALSLAKIMGILYAIMGLIIGGLFSLIGLISAGLMTQGEGEIFGLIFGLGAVIILPIMYGILGFIGGLITAGLYNLLSGFVGGIEMEFEQNNLPTQTQMPS